ncbi:MAG: sulfur carrier protein ThiS [Pirellulales bacterium]|nr:sulfur carrier protein ThiS [Planctomycetia bacterium]MDO7677388.1 sulfur carrier protein ThiS [Pirellulales bacterium]
MTHEFSVMINGTPRDVSQGATAQDVVKLLGLQERPVAVEVNMQVVPRRELAACLLCAGDRLEIVTLVGGG